MSSKAKRVGTSRATLEITITKDQTQQSYSELLKKYQKQMQMPGFRKGKAPVSVIEAKYGSSIFNESVFNKMNDILEEELKNVEEGLSPLPYAKPELENEESILPFKKDTDITFNVIYDVYPEFELPKYTGMKLEYPNVEVGDKQVEEEIERLRKQNSVVKEKQGNAANGDIVTVDYIEEGKPETKRENVTIKLGENSNIYKIDSDLVGLKAGDNKKIEKDYSNEEDKNALIGDKVVLNVTVKNVKEEVLPDLDNEFAQDVKEEYKTVDDLKKGLKERLVNHLEQMIKDDKANAAVEEILKNTNFDVPKSMLNLELESRFREFAKQMGMNSEQMENYLSSMGMKKSDFIGNWTPEATNRLKGQLVIEAIKKKENIKATEEEVKKAMDDELKEVKDEKQKEAYKPIIEDNLATRATIEFILKNNKFSPTKEKIAYEEFISGAYLNKKEEAKEKAE